MRPLFASAALVLLAGPAAAAQEFVDRGVFVIERGSAETGRVEFAVRRGTGSGHNSLLLVSATRTPAHEVQIALEVAAADSLPISFQETETNGGRLVRRVSAAVTGRRFSARASSAESEVARELPVSAPLLILGDDDYTAYQFLPSPDSGASLAVTLVRASDLTPVSAVIEGGGTDSIRAGGRTLPCRRFTLRLLGGEERTFWRGSGGILVRVALPALGLSATRQ